MAISILTHLISMSKIGSVDQSGKSIKVWICWPLCLVKAVS